MAMAPTSNSSTRRGLGVALVVLIVVQLFPAPNAEAACGDVDFLCQINALDQDLGVTKTTMNALDATVGFLSTQVSAMSTLMDSVVETFNELSQDVIQVVQMFGATAEMIASDTMTLTTDVVQRIEDAGKLIDFFATYERDRYLEFVGTNGCSATCEAFRGQIIALLGHVESTANLGFEALAARLLVETNQSLPPIPQLDLEPLRDVLLSAPGVVLYALYRSIPLISVEGEPPPGISYCEPGNPTCALAVLNGLMAQAEGAFQMVIDLSANSAGSTARTWSAVTSEHQACLDNLVGDFVPGITRMTAAEYGSSVLTVIGTTMKALGLSLEGFALTGLTDEDVKVGASVAIHAGAGLRSNKARIVGRVFKILGAIAGQVGAELEKMVADCRTRLNNGVVMCWLSVKNPVPGNKNQPSTYESCMEKVANGASF